MNYTNSINTTYALNTVLDAVDYWIQEQTGKSIENCYIRTDNFYDFWKDFTLPKTVYTYYTKSNVTSYPVSNYGIDADGTTIIEIAVSGFDAKDIEIKRKDLKLIVKGKKQEEEKDNSIKWAYRNIGERNFELLFDGSDKWDWEKAKQNVELKNGILTIKIPLKEEAKPITETFEIKTK